MTYDILNNRFQASDTIGCSSPFQMDGTNAVVVQLTSIIGTLTWAKIVLSDDLENWHSDVSLTVPGSAPGMTVTTVLGLGAPYCRLSFKAATGGAIFNACLSTATL